MSHRARAASTLLALGSLLAGCEAPSPGRSGTPAPAAEDGLSGLSLAAPLPTKVERRDRQRPLDAERQELVITHEGGQVRLLLERHDSLVGSGYRTYEVDASGLHERPAKERPPFCHYLGHVVLDDGSLGASASVTTCDAEGRERFSALLLGSAQWVELRPAPSGNGLYELARLERPATYDDLDDAPSSAPSLPDAPGLRAQATAAGSQLIVELLTMNDAARQRALGGVAAAELSTLGVANHMANVTAAAALQPPLVVGLVGQLTFTTDPYSVALSSGEVAATDLLTQSAAWAASAPLPEHDARQLYTGLELQSSTVGLAYVGTACNRGFGAGIVQATFSTPAVANIATHELGHTLGMSHDESLGCGSTFIMATSTCVSCSQQPAAFSSCSQTSLTQFLAGNVTCLADPVTPASSAPSCGNGVVEAGEQCDCGGSSCGARDTCCNGATCQLKAGASCSATQPCCNPALCSLQPLGATCRAAVSSCDVAETCSGSSAVCPSDTYAPAGRSCADASGGLCFEGECLSRAAQCTAAEAAYPQLTPPLVPCESTTCGTMRCRSGSSCFILTGRPFADGTPCGTARQCSGGECVPSSQLEPAPVAQPAPALGGVRWSLGFALLVSGMAASTTIRRRSRALISN